jgi:hypothetical protein
MGSRQEAAFPIVVMEDDRKIYTIADPFKMPLARNYFLLQTRFSVKENIYSSICIKAINDNIDHYKWLEKHIAKIQESLTLDKGTINSGVITAHGNKCEKYKDEWAKESIPFPHGAAMYLLTYFQPWRDLVRDTRSGFVPPVEWVINNYPSMKKFLPAIDLTDSEVLR